MAIILLLRVGGQISILGTNNEHRKCSDGRQHDRTEILHCARDDPEFLSHSFSELNLPLQTIRPWWYLEDEMSGADLGGERASD